MSIRRIKANKAEIDGDYVKVETFSQRPIVFFTTLISLLIIYAVVIDLNRQDPEHLFFSTLAILFASIIMTALAPGKVLRDIPLVDLVEIKRYAGEDKVTVVLDDERAKRNQLNKKV